MSEWPNQAEATDLSSVKYGFKSLLRYQGQSPLKAYKSERRLTVGIDRHYTESYRSGHNGAVLKTVESASTRHGGSNPSLSANMLSWLNGRAADL